MCDCVSEQRAVEEVLFLPLLLKSEVCAVDAGCDRSVSGNICKCCCQRAVIEVPVRESVSELSPVRAADANECNIKCDDHRNDADRDADLDLGVNVLRKVNDDQDDQHDACADLPIKPEEKVHACAGSGNVAHREEEAGEEQADAAEGCSCVAVVVADRVKERHSGQHGNSIGDHHENDSHQDDRDNDPDHIIAVVRAEHGGCRDVAGADNDACHDDARADPFQDLHRGELFNALGIKIVCICHFQILSVSTRAGRTSFDGAYIPVRTGYFYDTTRAHG